MNEQIFNRINDSQAIVYNKSFPTNHYDPSQPLFEDSEKDLIYNTNQALVTN